MVAHRAVQPPLSIVTDGTRRAEQVVTIATYAGAGDGRGHWSDGRVSVPRISLRFKFPPRGTSSI
jgi:hypothetical protein